ncbi:MAG: hypothetical protein J6M53_04450 [Bacteroidaceae bacterium]|nr:hypothetical protein [Bacteroidaceae bacterium]
MSIIVCLPYAVQKFALRCAKNCPTLCKKLLYAEQKIALRCAKYCPALCKSLQCVYRDFLSDIDSLLSDITSSKVPQGRISTDSGGAFL